MQEFLNRSWKQTFRVHVLILERFLLQSRLLRVNAEQLVFVAGMVARRLDAAYQLQIQDFLLEEPDQLDGLIRRHAPYIGQNAPILTISRINGEFLIVDVAFKDRPGVTAFDLSVAARYCDVAAFFARQAGNRSLADLFAFLRKNCEEVVRALAAYQTFLANGGPSETAKLPAGLWERFATERNDRNDKKERWERMGLDAKHKQHIDREEFNRMLDFSSPN